MQNYDIRYDDTYGQLAQIDVAAEGAGYEPWVNQTLTSVNDCVVRLAVIEGELVDWHSHEHEDEFFLVLEGRLELEVQGREPFLLGVHQGVTIPRGVVHRPRAHGRTVLLMVEPATVIPTGNDSQTQRRGVGDRPSRRHDPKPHRTAESRLPREAGRSFSPPRYARRGAKGGVRFDPTQLGKDLLRRRRALADRLGDPDEVALAVV